MATITLAREAWGLGVRFSSCMRLTIFPDRWASCVRRRTVRRRWRYWCRQRGWTRRATSDPCVWASWSGGCRTARARCRASVRIGATSPRPVSSLGYNTVSDRWPGARKQQINLNLTQRRPRWDYTFINLECLLFAEFYTITHHFLPHLALSFLFLGIRQELVIPSVPFLLQCCHLQSSRVKFFKPASILLITIHLISKLLL